MIIAPELEKKLWIPTPETADLDLTATNRTRFSPKRAEKFLPTLPTDEARLLYLINIRARFNKMPVDVREMMNPDKDFSHYCDVEIERLKQSKLEITLKQTNNEEIKPKGLNRESAFLFFEYLFNYAEVQCDKKKKAEVIERLTKYSHKKVVPLFSWFEKEKLYLEDTTDLKNKFSNDMNFARECFELLNLIEVVEKIDKDLGN